MRIRAGILLASAAWMQCGCSLPAPKSAGKKEAEPAPPAKITQFYATVPKLQLGEQELLCYRVENATSVWLTPPRQQLTASLSRCIEVAPPGTTIYRLYAEGSDGTSD